MDKKWWGQYVAFTLEPEDDKGKAEYVKKAVEMLLDRLVPVAKPDWNTLQLIVREGVDIRPSSPDWYDNEKEGYKGPRFGWMMTVGIKYQSEDYIMPISEEEIKNALTKLEDV